MNIYTYIYEYIYNTITLCNQKQLKIIETDINFAIIYY